MIAERSGQCLPAANFVPLFAAAFLLLHPGMLGAQEIERDRSIDAPRALVLGAGGSRGLAHAGVLVGLEGRGHDADLVVGASMGAVVGAHYAAGYAPETIWRLITDIDWQEKFSPLPTFIGPERALRHPAVRAGRTKRADQTNRDPVGTEGAWGLVPEWRVNRLLVRNLFDASVRSRGDFDRLPRRFRAVATDLETGELVVLADGDLALAVRASMGAPGAFRIVRWQGRILVDGGVADYLPVAVARNLGASHVTASDVLEPGDRVEEFSPLRVGLRGFRLLLRNTRDREPDPDLLLLPEIDATFAELTFPRDPTPLLEAGLAAAGALPTQGEGPGPGPTPALRSPGAGAGPPTHWDGPVSVEADDPAAAVLVEGAFRSITPGTYDPEAVLEAVDRLYATGLFEGIWPRSAPSTGAEDDESRVRLVVLAETRPRESFDAAAAYEVDRGLRGWTSFGRRFGSRSAGEISLTTTADRERQEASTTLRLHSRNRVPLAWTAGAHLRRTDARLFEGGRLKGHARVERIGGWAGLEGRSFSPERFLVATLAVEQVGGPDAGSGLSIGPMLRFGRSEPFNRIVGAPTDVQMDVRWGQAGYWMVRTRGSVDGEAGSYSAAVLADLAIAHQDAPLDVFPSLGHDQLVPALRWGEARGRMRTVVGVDLARFVGTQASIRFRLRAGAAVPEVSDLRDRSGWATGGEVAFVRPTPVGPVVAGISANTRGTARLELRVGPTF
ncbi:MAG: hypothetical protein EA350_12890 [Gemmatimonadales bacterium]|nr:MAG: hypothetical protein EA350_12890 [Gemmatimonadales bacterium]